MKRWLIVPILLVVSLTILGGNGLSQESKVEPEVIENEAGYQVIRLQDRSLDDVELAEFCLQFGNGIFGCRIVGSDNKWAVRYQWTRLQDNPTKLIASPDFLKMEMDGKIKTDAQFIPAFYSRLLSGKSKEAARKEAIKSKYWNPPSALVDSVYSEVERITGKSAKDSGGVKIIRPN